MEADYKYLIPRALHSTYDQLQGPLRDLFIFRLFPAEDEIFIDVAILALNILAKSPKNNASFEKLKERFFIGFIKNVNGRLKSTLEKILEITKEGFFADLLDKADSKKTIYYPPDELTNIIEQFYSQIFPVLKKQKQDKNVSSQDLQQASSSTLLFFDQLMKCDKYFAFPKLGYQFLDSLPPQKKWNKDTYVFFFKQLDLSYHLEFDDYEKVELSKAIFRLHSPQLKESFLQCSEIDLNEFLTLCRELKSRGGEELLDFYLSSLQKFAEPSIDEMIRVLNILLSQLDKSNFFDQIEKWKEQKYDWKALIALLENELVEGGLPEHAFKEDIDIILARFRKDPTVEQSLSDEDIALIRKQYIEINQLCKKYNTFNFNKLINIAHQIREKIRGGTPVQESDRLHLFAIGRLALRLEFGVYLYSTQVLALLALFLKDKSRQGQVKTGQGKSLIVSLWAFIRSMECRAPDIITSARYLAVRDHHKSAHFFKRCGIETAHICYDKKIPQHFKAQVLYGPAFDFEFAWMQDILWGRKLFQQRLLNPFVSRNFDVVCVDESDNLLIDTARNGARLGSPAESSFDWIYSPILSFVALNKGMISSDLEKALFHLKNYLKEHIAEQNIKVCEQLKDQQLMIWLKSAHRALFELKENIDYVIRIVIEYEQPVRTIQIVDIETGRISENSRWSNGIHEFLEVKHDIVVQKESITPLSLSHAVFYGFYKTVTALTGTAERFQTKEIYGIDSFDVPPHQPLQRVDLPPVIAKNTAEFYHLIVQKTKECVKNNRPILILCRTIQDTLIIEEELKKHGISFKLLNEIQQEPEQVIVAQAGDPGKVTIATNTAGRGTDIIPTKESLQNGGLHVLPVFPFESKRSEDQGIGRAGRQGQPGSSQSILNREDPQIQKLIESQGKDLLDEEIIVMLHKQRELREKSEAKMQIAFAGLERFLAEKTHLFFNLYRTWADYVEQDTVLGNFAEKLSTFKLKSKKLYKFEHIANSDLLIANECIRLLSEKSEILSWKVFLQKGIERMKQKLINEWVKSFFEPAENQCKTVGLKLNLLKTKLEEVFNHQSALNDQDGYTIFDLIGQHYLSSVNECLDLTKSEINKEFANQWVQWEKLLAIDGSGLFLYLKEITTIDLSSTIFKSK